MGLIEQAQLDVKAITSNSNEWGVSITFLAPDASTATINGIHIKVHLGIDTEGNMVNTKQSRISFSESLLIAAGYPTRNGRGDVDFKKHIVTVKDSTGTVCKYIIRQWFPDEALGFILCHVDDYQ